MAIESVTANAGTGGSAFAVDTITGSVQVPYTKLMSGTDAAEDLIGGDAANGLDVDVTRVSGTVTVDGSGVTQPVSAASLPLPTGAATAAKQPALGTAGTASADVITVQGIASMTALIVNGSGVTQPVSGTVTAAQATAANLNATVVGTGTFAVQAACTNAGTFAVQVDGAALTALQLIDNTIVVDDAAFTPATTSVNMAGFEADETATDSVDEGDAGAARMTLDRKQIVTPQPHASGGLSIFRSLDLDETEEEVSAAACTVYSVWVTNTSTGTRFVKFYNATAANTTVGTTTPLITIGIPGNATDDIAGHFAGGGYGITFGTALTVAATTGVADADTGAPGANDVVINIFYK